MFTDPTDARTIGLVDQSTHRCPCGEEFISTTKRVPSAANAALATSVENWEQFYARRQWLAEHHMHTDATHFIEQVAS